MSISVSCPHCDAQLRFKRPPASAKITCPECSAIFRWSDPEYRDGPRRGSREDRDRDGPRRKKPAESSGLVLFLAIGVVGLLLLVGGGTLTAFLLYARSKSALSGPDNSPPLGGIGVPGLGMGKTVGGIPAAMLAYAPNDTFKIDYANVKRQLQDLGNDASQLRFGGFGEVAAFERFYGSVQNVDGHLTVHRSTRGKKGNVVTVVTFVKSVDRAALTNNGEQRQAGGKIYYLVKRPGQFDYYLHFPTDTMMVGSPTEVMLQEVMAGDGGQFPQPFAKLVTEADGHKIMIFRPPQGGTPLRRMECRIRTADKVAMTVIEEFENEEFLQQGRANWEERSTRRKRRDETVSYQVNGLRITGKVLSPPRDVAW